MAGSSAPGMGVRQLRRKQPVGGGSVLKSTGAAADDAAAVGFARLASLAAVIPASPWDRAASTAGRDWAFPFSVERKRRQRGTNSVSAER